MMTKRNKVTCASSELPSIPDKMYFSIKEASYLCSVKQHVLRYWEKEFPQLSPIRRAGSRRYYQPKDIVLIRNIKKLLYEDGYTISGARSCLMSEDKNANECGGHDLRELLKITLSKLENILLEIEKNVEGEMGGSS